MGLAPLTPVSLYPGTPRGPRSRRGGTRKSLLLAAAGSASAAPVFRRQGGLHQAGAPRQRGGGGKAGPTTDGQSASATASVAARTRRRPPSPARCHRREGARARADHRRRVGCGGQDGRAGGRATLDDPRRVVRHTHGRDGRAAPSAPSDDHRRATPVGAHAAPLTSSVATAPSSARGTPLPARGTLVNADPPVTGRVWRVGVSTRQTTSTSQTAGAGGRAYRRARLGSRYSGR